LIVQKCTLKPFAAEKKRNDCSWYITSDSDVIIVVIGEYEKIKILERNFELKFIQMFDWEY